MTRPPSANGVENSNYSIPLLLALIAAGLAGNYFKFPIFFGIDFLFGSIFAMLALQFFGLGRGVLAAAIIAGYTYFLWNHPYAIIIMTAEVAVVGWLMGRRKMGMVLADTLYWLIIGMPLVYLFYHVAMQVPFSNTFITMTKQAVNGIANALLARLIFTGYALRSRSSLTSYREIVYNLLAFFVLCPTLILLAIGSRTDFADTDLHIRTLLMNVSQLEKHRLEVWLINRKLAIINLAEMSASRSPQQMQPYLEQAKKSDVNFLRVGLLDREATTTAFYPLLDELGQQNIGKNFADRSFIPRLKQTLKPMLSDVYIGKVGIPKPVVSVLAPVVIRGTYSGYVIGVLSLQQLQDYLDYLDKSSLQNTTLYTLLDKNGNVIMSNRADQKVMTPLVRGKGTLHRLDHGISQWVPVLPPNTPVSERWKKSFYIAETNIGDLAEWRLILEQPVAPFQKTLYDNYTGKLTMLFLIMLVALALAELFSRNIVVTLDKLRTLTHDLPVRLATDGKEIAWPESGIKEANYLIDNFREMAASLTAQFSEVRQINESLEQRVEERTDQLRLFKESVENSSDAIGMSTPEGKHFYQNEAFNNLFGEIGEHAQAVYVDENVGKEVSKTIMAGERWSGEVKMYAKDRTVLNILVRAYANKDANDRIIGLVGIYTDITERRRAEDALRESEAFVKAVMDNLPIGIAVNSVDPAVSFKYTNDNFPKFYRTTREALDDSFWNAVYEEPEFREEIKKRVLDDCASGDPARMHWVDVPITRRGEETTYIEARNISLPDRRLMVSTVWDVTGQKRAEQSLAEKQLMLEELNKSLEQRVADALRDLRQKDQMFLLQSRQAAMGEMIGNIAHQWRQPLNMLGLIVQELPVMYKCGKLSQEYLDSDACKAMELIHHMSKTIDDFRNFFSPDKEKVQFKVNQIVAKTLALIEQSLKTVNIKVEVNEINDAVIDGYPNEYSQVLLNIINNARDAFVERQIERARVITITIITENDRSVVIIADNAGGIPEEAISKIFEPYFTTKGQDKGTGVGLYMAKNIIEKNMGGRLEVRNIADGAEFRIEV